MPRKSINIITPHYSPEITAAAHRMESVAKKLSSAFRVQVFTLAERGSKTENHSVRFDENLTVHYLRVRKYPKSFFFLRAIFEWWYAKKLVKKSNEFPADLAIVTVPFMFLLPVVARYCNAKKKIADVRDLVWHYLPGEYFNKPIKKSITSLMHRSLSRFDAITVTNESEKHWLVENAFVDEEKINVFPNGISAEKFAHLSSLSYAPNKFKYTITYVGNLGSSQRIIPLIKLVMHRLDFRVNLIGDGNEIDHLRKYISKNKIKNVFIHGRLPWMRAASFYQSSDLLFASLKENFDTAIPSKLYEYLATGLPVFYYGGGAAANFLDRFENVHILKFESMMAFDEVLEMAREARSLRSDKNVKIIGKEFIRERISQRFVELSARLLNEKVLSELFVEDILQSAKP